MLRSRVLALTATLAAVTVALAGCSTDEKGTGTGPTSGARSSSAPSSSAAAKPADATTFVTDSLDAFEQAPAAHVAGTFAGAADGKDLAVDISYGDKVAKGTLTVDGNQIELSEVADGTTYFKADAAFWTSSGAPADAVATLAGKYVRITADTEGFSDFANLLDRSKFVDQVRPSESDLGAATVSGPTEVNGVSCFGIVDTDGKGAYYAAASGTPYPVQLKSQGDGELNFDGYTGTVEVPAPDPADVVDLPSS